MEDNRAKKLLDSFVDRLKANKRLEIAVYCGLGALCLLLCRHTEEKSKRRVRRSLRRFSRTILSRGLWIR